MNHGPDDKPAASPLRWLLWVLPLGFVAYAVLLGVGDIGASVDVLSGIDLWLVSAAVALEVVTVLSLAQVYRSSLAAVGGRVSYDEGLETSMTAYTVSQALPGGGAVAVVVAARRLMSFGASKAAAAATTALSGILAMLTLGMLVVVGALVAVTTTDLPAAVLVGTLVVVAVLALVTAVLLAALRSVAFGQRLLDLGQRLLGRFGVDLEEWRSSLVEVAGNRPTLTQLSRVIGWSAVNWAGDIAALWLILAGLGETLSIGVLLLAVGIANVVILIPISPGGVGLVEAGMSGVLVALGVPGAVAVAGVLGYRVLSYWLPMLAGIPQYLRTPNLHASPT